MWYVDEASFMKQMVRYTVPNADIKANRDAVKHCFSFLPAPRTFRDLVLYYPGYKEAVGDYKLTFLGNDLKHSDICKVIFDYSSYDTDFPKFMALVLKEIYKNGIDAMSPLQNFSILIGNKAYSFEQFKTLLYWITLQEEINYPLANNKMSVKLPFSRYYESIYVAYLKPKNITINEIMERADGNAPLKILQRLNAPQNITLPKELLDLYKVINS